MAPYNVLPGEGNGTPLQYSCLENPMDGGAWWAAVHGVAKSRTRLSDFTFMFHFHALEKEMATHSSVLAWRILGTVEPGGLLSMGSHRIGHDWSDLAAAAAPTVNVPWGPELYSLDRGLQMSHIPQDTGARLFATPENSYKFLALNAGSYFLSPYCQGHFHLLPCKKGELPEIWVLPSGTQLPFVCRANCWGLATPFQVMMREPGSLPLFFLANFSKFPR